MKIFLTAIVVMLSNFLLAQDSTKCSCIRTFSIRYPKKAEENKISGQVIIEMDRDENCMLSNPIVKKGLDFGCDEEAIRIVKLQIAFYNDCTQRCKMNKGCSKGKINQPVTFQLNE
jgi:protein TonB